MKEIDYIKAGDLARLRAASMILGPVMRGDNYLATEDEMSSIMKPLYKLIDRGYSSVKNEIE